MNNLKKIFFVLLLSPVYAGFSQPVKVGPGEYQCFIIDSAKHLYAIVTNYATIGTGGKGTIGKIAPVAVMPEDLKFKSVAGSLHGGLAVDTAGYVWCWGDADEGKMGDGNNYKKPLQTPVKILTDSSGKPFKGISKVFSYFTALKYAGNYAIKGTDSTLWIWGPTFGGMRGDGSYGNINTRPIQIHIPGKRKVVQAVAGYQLIVLCSDGTVWTCGGSGGAYANLGYAGKGDQYLTLHRLDSLSNIVEIAGGQLWNYALKANGTLYGWGQASLFMGISNKDSIGTGREVPVPTELTEITSRLPHRIKKIVVNSSCTHVILSDSTLWGWGDNAQGNIGNGEELDYSNTPAPYAWNYGFGKLLQKYPVQVSHKHDFIAVFGSAVLTFYTYAEDVHGQLYSWGRNKGSVLGNGVVGASPDIQSIYANSWDVPMITAIHPFSMPLNIIWSTSPYCKLHPDTKPCNQYRITDTIKPIAKICCDQTVTLPDNSIILDGTASSDNQNIVYYKWRQVSGPSPARINIPSGISAKVSGLVAGEYVFKLTVIDNSWNSDSSSVQIKVNPRK